MSNDRFSGPEQVVQVVNGDGEVVGDLRTVPAPAADAGGRVANRAREYADALGNGGIIAYMAPGMSGSEMDADEIPTILRALVAERDRLRGALPDPALLDYAAGQLSVASRNVHIASSTADQYRDTEDALTRAAARTRAALAAATPTPQPAEVERGAALADVALARSDARQWRTRTAELEGELSQAFGALAVSCDEREAAEAENARLRAENERLRGALEFALIDIEDYWPGPPLGPAERIRAALAATPQPAEARTGGEASTWGTEAPTEAGRYWVFVAAGHPDELDQTFQADVWREPDLGGDWVFAGPDGWQWDIESATLWGPRIVPPPGWREALAALDQEQEATDE